MHAAVFEKRKGGVLTFFGAISPRFSVSDAAGLRLAERAMPVSLQLLWRMYVSVPLLPEQVAPGYLFSALLVEQVGRSTFSTCSI